MSKSSSDRFYYPELDGLRFCAFFGVFVHHSLPNSAASWAPFLGQHGAELISALIRMGAYGVDFFFCLSAFLITELLIREFERFGSISIKDFFIRRVLRIWPLYYVFLLLSVVFFPLISSSYVLDVRQFLSFFFIFANWECAINGYPKSPIAPLWSISIEEQFYLVWPLTVRAMGIARLPLLVIALFVIAMTTRAVLISRGVVHPGIWCNTLARLDSISAGVALTLVVRRLGVGSSLLMRALLVAGASLSVLLVSLFVSVSVHTVHLVWSYLAVALACAALIYAVLGAQGRVSWLFKNKVIVYLGRISYGLYVTHVLGLKLVAYIPGIKGLGASYIPVTAILGFGLTIVMSIFFYYVIEKPFLKLKDRFSRVRSRPES